jgi:hypothetical protein
MAPLGLRIADCGLRITGCKLSIEAKTKTQDQLTTDY